MSTTCEPVVSARVILALGMLAARAAAPAAADFANSERRERTDDLTFSMMQALHMLDVLFVGNHQGRTLRELGRHAVNMLLYNGPRLY